jgi:rhamnosyltransferase
MEDAYDNSKIAGLIVTYNPDITVLENVLVNTICQVSIMYIIDNCSVNANKIRSLASKYSINLIINDKNFGLAKGLNIGISKIIDNPYIEWVLILDQDSIPQNDYAPSLIRRLIYSKLDTRNVWAIRGVERYIGKGNLKTKDFDYKIVTGGIMSGSLINMNAFSQVAFRDDLFLDLVDYYFYLKIRESGHITLQFNYIYLSHTLGKTIKMKGRPTTYENPFRMYLIVRNSILLILEGNLDYWLLWNIFAASLPVFYIDGIIKASSNLLKGILDGFSMRINKNNAKSHIQFPE